MIYQVFLGRWKQANISKHQGKVLEHLETMDWLRLKEKGFSAIYFLGLFDNRGPIIVDSESEVDLNSSFRVPSVFALSDHRGINPLLGTKNDFIRLLNKLHQIGFKVIVDFVPNHRGLSHTWLNTHPNYFSYDSEGLLIKEFSGDVAKLNYRNLQLRQESLETLLYIQDLGLDGVRCDMAHLVDLDFWRHSISLLKTKNQQFLVLGEVYPENNFDLSIYEDFVSVGFDFVYHGVLFKLLEEVLNGNSSLAQIVEHLNYVSKQKYANHLIHYFANHDDYLKNYQTHLEAIICLLVFLAGETLVFNGSLVGRTKRLAHHIYDELPSHELESPIEIPNFQKMIELSDSYSLVPNSLVRSDNNLIQAKLGNNQGAITHEFLINLGDCDQNISTTSNKSGLIHEYQSNDLLRSGEAEIYLVES